MPFPPDKLIYKLLRRRSPEDLSTLLLLTQSWLGIVCFPLFYFLFRFVFPQPYENLPLRTVGVALCLGGFLARRLPLLQRERYGTLLLAYCLPFFTSYMFLMNHANPNWTQALLAALIGLFQAPFTAALRAYAAGTLAAVLLAIAQGEGAVLLSQPVLQLLPIHWLIIGVMAVARVSRRALEFEKLNGLGEGLGAVAHELRTPLASIDANLRGLSRMQQRAGAPCQDTSEALMRAQQEVRHMNHMIDLFLLSAMAMRKPADPDACLSMREIVNEALRRFPFASAAQRQLVIIQVRYDFQFRGQRDMAVIIVLNLLRNALQAIQRAGKGRVRIVVDGARYMPRLLVIDTACGIPHSHLPLIFRRFYAFPAHNGPGIGLALCRQILSVWQARLRCVSREHAYAIFILEFPRSGES
jgi:two-component system CAI-1 autoinducer sensor kinase/phosphatase CqsS